MYLGNLGIVVNPLQGGQGAIALIPNVSSPFKSPSPAVTKFVTDWKARQAAVKPVDLVPVLPTMRNNATRPGPTSGGCLTVASVSSGQDDEPQTPTSCQLSTWVENNPTLAILAVLGVFLAFKR